MGIVSKMKRGVKEFTGSIRRNKLGLGIFEGGEAWYYRNGQVEFFDKLRNFRVNVGNLSFDERNLLNQKKCRKNF